MSSIFVISFSLFPFIYSASVPVFAIYPYHLPWRSNIYRIYNIIYYLYYLLYYLPNLKAKGVAH
jgi:hypothetical protein